MTKDEIADIMYCYLDSYKENIICYTPDNAECVLPIVQLFTCLLTNTYDVFVVQVNTNQSIKISLFDLQC